MDATVMARPRTGKIVEKELRVPQKNGDIYVYWRSTKYDPETRNTKTLSKKLDLCGLRFSALDLLPALKSTHIFPPDLRCYC